MEANESKFNAAALANLSSGYVASGSKSSGSSTPQLIATSTYNKFNINSAAKTVMGLGDGDHVVFFDMMSESSSMEDRFYICKGWDNGTNDKGELITTGAKIGAGNNFNYSRIYGVILNQDSETIEINKRDLIKKGLLVERKDEGVVATNKVFCELVAVSEDEVAVATNDQGEVLRQVFALTSYDVVSHNARTEGEPFNEDE